MFDLKNYTMLYSISDENVQEIKIRLVLQNDASCSRCVLSCLGGGEGLVHVQVTFQSPVF